MRAKGVMSWKFCIMCYVVSSLAYNIETQKILVSVS